MNASGVSQGTGEGMEELDVIWMAILAGTPLVGALLAGLAPRKWPDLGAWITVLSTALSLSLAIAILIQYRYDTLEQLGVLNDLEFRHKATQTHPAKPPRPCPKPRARKFAICCWQSTNGRAHLP